MERRGKERERKGRSKQGVEGGEGAEVWVWGDEFLGEGGGGGGNTWALRAWLVGLGMMRLVHSFACFWSLRGRGRRVLDGRVELMNELAVVMCWATENESAR